MPTKQIKITLQATPAAEQDVNVLITVDGVTKFNQTVPAAGASEQGVADPSESIQFDLDLPAATANVKVQNHDLSCAVTNGSAKIELIAANFSWTFNAVANAAVAGDANTFRTCDIVSQPLWNGDALLERYDISYNRGPEQVTGPGEVLILSGETVTFTLEVPQYNDALPLPN